MESAPLLDAEEIEALLGQGENDQVEFKPFIRPRGNKEAEIVKTVVAFANTSGGTILLGVSDDTTPEGIAAAHRAFPDQDDPIDAVQQWVRKLVIDEVRPVPEFDVTAVDVRGHPAVVVRVGPGATPPYANRQHDAYVRRGSSNLKADPSHDWADLMRRRRAPW